MSDELDQLAVGLSLFESELELERPPVAPGPRPLRRLALELALLSALGFSLCALATQSALHFL